MIASNRRYMRGAGTAEEKAAAPDPTVEREAARKTMRFCAVSGQSLDPHKTMVTCPFGRLYHKEAVVEVLLRRKQGEANQAVEHIRGLKDLTEVRFHWTTSSEGDQVPTCPITGRELNGLVEAYVLSPGKGVNVLSQHGMKQMGTDNVETEYGPVEKKIRLAPPADVLQEIQQSIEEKLAKKKNKRKRKDNVEKESKKKPTNSETHVSLAAKAAVSAAVKKSSVLSSLLSSGDSKMSDKEKKDHLFART